MPFYYPGRGRDVPPSAPVSPKTMPATAIGTTTSSSGSSAPRPVVPPLRTTPGTGHSTASSSLFDSALAQYRSFPVDVPPRTATTTTTTMASSIRSLASSSAAASSRSILPPPLPPPPPPPPLAFTHDDTERSRRAYAQLADRARAYREALGALSAAASGFGAALETCARLKEARDQPYPPGPYSGGGGGGGGRGSSISGASIRSGLSSTTSSEPSCTADVLLAASGLYYLQANQQGILGETVYRAFELPVVHELDRYGADVEAEQAAFEAGMRDASRHIRRLEKEGAQLRRTRHRDLGAMRTHLVDMTAALDALTVRQAAHAVALLDQSRALSAAVSHAGRTLVRAELDILDSLARKGWPGGGLDVLLDGADDVFARDDDDDDVVDDHFHTTTPLASSSSGAGAGAGAGAGGAVAGVATLTLTPTLAPTLAPTLTPTTPAGGPKLLLLGQNGPAGAGANGGSGSGSGGSRTPGNDSYDLFLGGTDDEDDDDGSDVSTIDGRDSPRKEAAGAAAATAGKPAEKTAQLPPARPRRKRVDSLEVDQGVYDEDEEEEEEEDDDNHGRRRPPHNTFRYQSLDSVAAAAASKTKQTGAAAAADKDAATEEEAIEEESTDDTVPPAGTAETDNDYDADEGVHAWRD